MKMCFILCDANALNERAWVRDTRQKAISGMKWEGKKSTNLK